MIPEIKKLLSGTVSIVLRKLSDQMDIHSTVYELLDRSMNENGTGNIRDGKYIKEGYSAELDEVRSLSENSRKWIADLEEREKEKTGIKLIMCSGIILKLRTPTRCRFLSTICASRHLSMQNGISHLN